MLIYSNTTWQNKGPCLHRSMFILTSDVVCSSATSLLCFVHSLAPSVLLCPFSLLSLLCNSHVSKIKLKRHTQRKKPVILPFFTTIFYYHLDKGILFIFSFSFFFFFGERLFIIIDCALNFTYAVIVRLPKSLIFFIFFLRFLI